MSEDIAAIVGKGWTLYMDIAKFGDGQYTATVTVQDELSPRGVLEIPYVNVSGDDPAGILAQALAEARRRVEGA